MTWAFDDETEVTSDGPGRWTARLSDQWNITDHPNGGYAAAVVLRAMARETSHEAPLSVTGHYLRPALGGADAIVRTEVVRTGRRTSTVTGTLVQDGQERLRVIGAFGDLRDPGMAGTADGSVTTAAGGPPDHVSVTVPDLPPPEACTERSALDQGVDIAIASRVEVRLHPDMATGAEIGRAEVAGWIRFRDGRPTDARALPLFADSFPPALFGLLGRVGWVPTVELTVHVRARPRPGWLRGRFLTDDLQDGRLIEDGWLWDEDGTLVARSRQLGLLLT